MITIKTNIGDFANIYSLYVEMKLTGTKEVDITSYEYCCAPMDIFAGRYTFEQIKQLAFV